MKKIFYSLLAFINCITGHSTTAQTLFTPIYPEESNVYFANELFESNALNIFSYGYLYNGGGVAVGDINNDGLPDLYFTGNRTPDKLYLNLGNLKFKDITDSSGIKSNKGYKTGVTMVDINSDGFLDIYVCRSVDNDPELRRNILFINNGNLTFTNKAKEYGLADAGYSTQAYFYDMDLDADLDMVLLNHPPDMNYANNIEIEYDEKGKLIAAADTARQYVSYRYYENLNGRFKDKTMSAGLGTHAFGLSAIIADFNDDGYPDIYSCNDYHEPDYLFINNKNKTFTNKATDYFKHFSYSSMGSDYADINNDGLLDLMVTDMLPESFQRQKELKGLGNYDVFNKRVQYGFGYQYAKNVLQLNNGNHTYSEISYLAGVAFTDWSWAPLIADFDNDGFKDIYVSNGILRDVTDKDFMVFEADSLMKELVKTKNTKETAELLASIPSNKIYNYLFRNNGNLTFTNATINSGLDIPSFSNGAAHADLDNDGDLDLVVNNITDYSFIFRNNTTENKTANFIRFKLSGDEKNKFGIGASINIETADGKRQVQHFNPDKGFLSCNEWVVHFGIGTNEKASATITWPNGTVQTIIDLNANAVYEVAIKNALPNSVSVEKMPTLFTDITAQTGISITQKENTYIDYKLEPLLPHQFSKQGPCIAVADINSDGTDDFFIGGSKDNEAFIYQQDSTGRFSIKNNYAVTADKKYEDTGAEFFDADNDGDKDLLVVSGGNESPGSMLQYPVRLYNNNGKGNFTRSTSFPAINTSGKAIAIDDYDKDGDADIFIGGRVVPGHYGLVPESFLLQNDSGVFTSITTTVPTLSKAGMITDAIWADVNNDSWKDLVIVGEWMPITIFKNNKGKLDSTAIEIKNTHGWWNSVSQIDIDNDGDLDLVGGNTGFNTRYKGNDEFPVTMVVNDFDNNGSTDCVISLFQGGISYPFALRENLLDQMPYLKKKFLRFNDYSNATVADIFSAEQLSKSVHYKANLMGSAVFINDGKGNFTTQLLSVKAQLFAVNAIIAGDYDLDGKTDLLIAGNDYSTEVETGRNDAGIGLMLKGQPDGKLKSVSVVQSGWYVPGDVKCMKRININNQPCFIIGKNNDAVQVIGLNY